MAGAGERDVPDAFVRLQKARTEAESAAGEWRGREAPEVKENNGKGVVPRGTASAECGGVEAAGTCGSERGGDGACWIRRRRRWRGNR